ncbi:MAG: hypothetical protein Q4P72_03890 [Eubacteriales bacterium]|nr:hypothetical protein [Eubacteriales bacterium]
MKNIFAKFGFWGFVGGVVASSVVNELAKNETIKQGVHNGLVKSYAKALLIKDQVQEKFADLQDNARELHEEAKAQVVLERMEEASQGDEELIVEG